MVKLNGNAIWDEFVDQPNIKNIPTIFDCNTEIRDTIQLLEYYLEKFDNAFINPFTWDKDASLKHFNFAWENDSRYFHKYSGHAKNIETAEMIAAETEILVVIGYSFPVFNREIDVLIFNRMRNLKKVYIQDKNPDRIKSTMENAFKILQRTTSEWSAKDMIYIHNPLIEFQTEQYTDQFLIPYELNY